MATELPKFGEHKKIRLMRKCPLKDFQSNPTVRVWECSSVPICMQETLNLNLRTHTPKIQY